jgi:ABC-type multidrug transport system fused ATPase/permease subunit
MGSVAEPVQERRDIEALLRRIWAAVVRYRRMIVAMIGFSLLQVLCTKVPFLVVQPLLDAMGQDAGVERKGLPDDPDIFDRAQHWFSVWFPEFSSGVTNFLGLSFEKPGMEVVVTCAVVTIVCGLLGAVTIYKVQTVSRFFAYRVISDLRSELARHFLSLPLRFFGRQRMGEMISKVTNDTQVMQRSFEMAADNVVVDPLMILGNMAIILFIIPKAVFVMIIMLPLMIYPMYRQGKKVQKRSSKSLQALGDTTESLNQILTGIRTVKGFQLEEDRMRDFDATTQTFLDRTQRVLSAKGRSIAQSFIGYQIATAVILVLLGYFVLVTGEVSFSAVSGIIAPLATNYQHVKRITRAYNVLRESAGALSGIETILRTAPDAAMIGGRPLDTVRGDVELRDLRFSYESKPVLQGVSLHAKAGQTVALVGPSGGGKSTTLDLLLRFHDPESGSILVDGHENILCGRPGATQEDVERAAKAANIHDFIVSQPDGYDSQAGERGTNLSGGQMQRITIARAILRDPAILFLDEATSALDTESEGVVQRALDTLREGRTSFVIAHRLSTIVDADQIIVLDEGRVVESGSHEQLMAVNGVYKRMVDQQMRPDAG